MIFKIVLDILIVLLIFYMKVLPYKDKLNEDFKSVFRVADTCFSKILLFMSKRIPNLVIGSGISIDSSQLVLLFILVLLLNVA